MSGRVAVRIIAGRGLWHMQTELHTIDERGVCTSVICFSYFQTNVTGTSGMLCQCLRVWSREFGTTLRGNATTASQFAAHMRWPLGQ